MNKLLFIPLLAAWSLPGWGASLNSNTATFAFSTGKQFVFDQFDPALGTLTRVDLEILSGSITTFSGIPTKSAPGGCSGGLGFSLYAYPTASFSSTLVDSVSATLFSSTCSFTTTTRSLAGVDTISDGTNMALFRGTSTLDVGLSVSGFGDSNVDFPSASLTGSARLTYYYDVASEAPEPGTWALFSTGLLAAMLWRRSGFPGRRHSR